MGESQWDTTPCDIKGNIFLRQLLPLVGGVYYIQVWRSRDRTGEQQPYFPDVFVW